MALRAPVDWTEYQKITYVPQNANPYNGNPRKTEVRGKETGTLRNIDEFLSPVTNPNTFAPDCDSKTPHAVAFGAATVYWGKLSLATDFYSIHCTGCASQYPANSCMT